MRKLIAAPLLVGALAVPSTALAQEQSPPTTESAVDEAVDDVQEAVPGDEDSDKTGLWGLLGLLGLAGLLGLKRRDRTPAVGYTSGTTRTTTTTGTGGSTASNRDPIP